MIQAFFWFFALIAIVSGLLCITRHNPVASALWLVVTLFALAAIYVLLDAQFIAAMQVIVYAGAIMVLFLFVIMLLNVGRPGLSTDLKGMAGKVTAAIFGAALLLELLVLRKVLPDQSFTLPAGSPRSLAELSARQGAVAMVAEPLFKAYLVPFEITSILLLAAVVGAVVLAKRRL